jgi:hypothetical protein
LTDLDEGVRGVMAVKIAAPHDVAADPGTSPPGVVAGGAHIRSSDLKCRLAYASTSASLG